MQREQRAKSKESKYGCVFMETVFSYPSITDNGWNAFDSIHWVDEDFPTDINKLLRTWMIMTITSVVK